MSKRPEIRVAESFFEELDAQLGSGPPSIPVDGVTYAIDGDNTGHRPFTPSETLDELLATFWTTCAL